jgi:hypothetical protein
MMAVLHGVGMFFRFVLRLVLLPVQAVLTLLYLAVNFVGGLAIFVFWLLGVFLVIGGIADFICNNSLTTMGWQEIVIGVLIAVIPQALMVWGSEGILGLKEFLAKILELDRH